LAQSLLLVLTSGEGNRSGVGFEMGQGPENDITANEFRAALMTG
jgi:hypothetical protein